MMSPDTIRKDDLFAGLPLPWPESLLDDIQRRIAAADECFVVLDDDPTGGQTLHGMPVLAAWDEQTLAAEIERSPAIFILTNSRALPETEAVALGEQIGRQLRSVAEKTGRTLVIGSRGDSTLRGHHPAETHALYRALTGDDQARPTCIFAPYFGEGGRFTVNDTQYVQQGAELVPVGDTEFARDPAFAYTHSHLPSWLQAGSVRHGGAPNVVSISIDDLRLGGPDAVAACLRAVPEGSTVIVNAACDRDLEVFVAGLLAAEVEGWRFLYRTAASFVRIRAGIEPRPLLSGDELGCTAGAGGLIVVGSYVDRTSQQLRDLTAREGLRHAELSVGRLFDGGFDKEVARATEETNRELRAGGDVVLFTSRDVVREAANLDSHAIGSQITAALCEVMRRLDQRPGFLLVKGGSTAYGVATGSLGVKRAMVLGQLLPGVPVWRLGEESKFPGLPYVIFPGNVGEADALNQALDVLHGGTHAGLG
jgi:uncharacterized protein YgbK (DUF1537 family)